MRLKKKENKEGKAESGESNKNQYSEKGEEGNDESDSSYESDPQIRSPENSTFFSAKDLLVSWDLPKNEVVENLKSYEKRAFWNKLKKQLVKAGTT